MGILPCTNLKIVFEFSILFPKESQSHAFHLNLLLSFMKRAFFFDLKKKTISQTQLNIQSSHSAKNFKLQWFIFLWMKGNCLWGSLIQQTSMIWHLKCAKQTLKRRMCSTFNFNSVLTIHMISNKFCSKFWPEFVDIPSIHNSMKSLTNKNTWCCEWKNCLIAYCYK